MKIIITQSKEGIFKSFCTKMTFIFPLKFLNSPHTGFIFFGSPFWNLKKWSPSQWFAHPPRVFMNSPLSRGENSLLWLWRVEPLTTLPVVSFRPLRTNRQPIYKFTVPFIIEYFVMLSSPLLWIVNDIVTFKLCLQKFIPNQKILL